jgi:thiol:disulfide interchange protein DsbD
MRLSWSPVLLLLLLLPVAALAQVAAQLVSPQSSVQPGQHLTVALQLDHQPGWHTFWERAGTGLPTRIQWDLPPGVQAGAIQWPVPTLIHNSQGEISGFGYEGQVYLPVELDVPANLAPGDTLTLRATARWLMCQTLCIPGKQQVALSLPVTAQTSSPNADVAAQLAKQSMPQPATGWTLAASRDRHEVTLNVAAPSAVSSPQFYPLDVFIDYKQPQTVANRDSRAMLKMALDPDETMPDDARLRGVLAYVDADGHYRGVQVDLPFVSAAAAAQVGAMAPGGDAQTGGGLSLGILALALLGGLILNLMPCVFPVLGIKVLGFVEQAGKDRGKVAAHAWTFAAGVLLSFWALAGVLALLRGGGEQLGWGFQLQSSGFVFALAVVMLAFALNLSGVFEVGMRATAVGSRLQMRQGLAGSFFAGVLATVVATPCSAPFLAPALGAALALPTGQSFVVFTAIALGLSAPYLLLATFPHLIRFLPRPGAWMETFKQLMAFPLYATVGYLLWVLAGQASEHGLLNALLALSLVALALWVYGRFSARGGAGRRTLAAGSALLLFAVALGWGWPRAAAPDAMQWQPWSPERVAELQQQGRGIYVDFTARWCATCQVNNKMVFGSDKVRRYFRENDIVALKADWTNADPRITRELARYGRSAVPFNLVYQAGSAAVQPEVLPEVLTPDIVLDAFGTSSH